MKKINTVEELKQVQLDILLAFHQFCVENNIKYSLAAGSLIGAVRHKGFIPWDDDIDVYLLRDDFKRLETIFPDVYHEKYYLLTLNREKEWPRAYGKMCDIRTVEIEEATNNYPMGVGIDVFPVDDVPDNLREWTIFENKRRFWRDFVTLKLTKYSCNRSFLKNVIILLSRCTTCFFSFGYLTRKLDRMAQENNDKGYNHVYENCPGLYNSSHPWLKEDMADIIDVLFEGHIVHIMKGYDDYLTTVYGDYMKLPPKEKRLSTHTVKAYWK